MANSKKNINRSAVNLLPTYFRTEKNAKFLSSTIDQLTKAPSLDRIDGFVGSKLSKNYNSSVDQYIDNSTSLRSNYQLEPGLIINELNGSIKKAFGLDDLVNQISYHGGNVSNLDRLFKPRFHSYDPKIDWDKLVNYREYYWLPTGPTVISVAGAQRATTSTFIVTDSPNKKFFIFTPDGLTEDPLITLYRGCQYIFNVDSVHKLYFKTQNTHDASELYQHGVVNNGTKSGQIIFTVDDTTPGTLFYSSDNSLITGGRIAVKSLVENSAINVDTEIIGKVNYSFSEGLEFVNGLKIKFIGDVYPPYYANKEFIVEGVGNSIKLIDFATLTTKGNIASLVDTAFDETPFDETPFDDYENTVPLTPEYITINKSSSDLNPWTRYNRWFHKDVIDISNKANEIKNSVYPNNFRAARPIIEFIPNIQLWNYGTSSLGNVDYIDTITTDAFSNIEGTFGYHVDGTLLENGDRVIFAADTDPLVVGRIYEVTFVNIKGKQKLNLVEVGAAVAGNVSIVNSGVNYRGTEWWFNGSVWQLAQQRSTINQAPLFDLFDAAGSSFSNKIQHTSDFLGNKIFGYSINANSTVNDSVLGFPLNYKSGSTTYLFENYFNNGTITTLTAGTQQYVTVPTSQTYIKVNTGPDSFTFTDIWADEEIYNIPVIQFQILKAGITEVEVIVFDNPALIDDLKISIYIDSAQLSDSDFSLVKDNTKLYVKLNKSYSSDKKLVFKCLSSVSANSKGYYEPPLNLTNNPLNGEVLNFTLSELTDHVSTMVDRSTEFTGNFPGVSNLKSLPNIVKYGTRLIKNQNPLAFAHCFITDTSNNLISAIREASNDYFQFKLNLINVFSQVKGTNSPAITLDLALSIVNSSKNSTFPYSQSDMLGYGDNKVTKSYTVKDSRTKTYSLSSSVIFDMTKLSTRAVLIYKTSGTNTIQLKYGIDYVFEQYNPYVTILTNISAGDIITINDYNSTVGTYIPPTPTKLGLYPKYEPSIYVDNSYDSGPIKVIQGHDGSISVAFSKHNEAHDFRDLALLEYETRIFNNLKTNYNIDLINIDTILPTQYNNSDYSLNEVNTLIRGEFLKWASVYGIDFSSNTTQSYMFKDPLPGHWRGVFKFYFGTDRPNTHPWEMLGFSIKPDWWENQYGPAPYTSGNLNLWGDLEVGMIRQGDRSGINEEYSRPGLTSIIPVNENGEIINIETWAIQSQGVDGLTTAVDWKFGDQGPAEASWRRSSYWPFAVQMIMALTKPADYAALMFDVSNLIKDITGKYYYGVNKEFISPKNVKLNSDTDVNGKLVATSGYSNWVIETGKKRSQLYLSKLKQDLRLLDFNLFHKAGGFLSKDKLEIIIDSVSPNTPNPGVTLPDEDYSLFFNVSNPVKTVSISGIIVEKSNGQFVVKGYDKQNPYFVINSPIYKASSGAMSVGGKSDTFLTWSPNAFYQAGNIILSNNVYYRVISSHNSGLSFDSSKYAAMASLPIVGGVSVLTTKSFEDTTTTIPYGSRFNSIQEIYDVIIGYGNWLGNQGFLFNEYNQDLAQVLDWNFAGKEFLYWTTQNWANGTIITLSPFANTIQFAFTDAVVDNVLNSFYDYSLLKADGQIFPATNFSISREEKVCTISTKNTTDGIFFARLNLVQKEHAIILNNTSMFNDVIYDIETGYRQLRVRLVGFKTSDWDGEFLSPGFVYDDAQINNWASYSDYKSAEVVKYAGKYYSAIDSIIGKAKFEFTEWDLLGSRPVAQLLPNFEYKINQFEDFYSMDIDNFDAAQQKMAQHLIGYTPRTYLDNIFVNPIAQYKFYQGFIREKGTKNAIDKLAKASIHNLQGRITYNEEWAFRIGSYGGYTSFNELEFPLHESEFRENSQIVKFIEVPPTIPNDFVSYITPSQIVISPDNYQSDTAFVTKTSTFADSGIMLPVAGYVRTDDITATAFNNTSLLDIANNGNIYEGNTVWVGFTDNNDWDVYRYTKQLSNVINSSISTPALVLTMETDTKHNLSVGDIVSITGLDNGTDGIYIIKGIPSLTSFDVDTTLTVVSESTTTALLFKFVSVRVDQFDNIIDLQDSIQFRPGDLVWVDNGTDSKWKVYQKSENYNSVSFGNNLTAPAQQFGHSIATSNKSNIVLISAPTFDNPSEGIGRVFVYDNIDGVMYPVYSYGISKFTNTQFGDSVAYFYDVTSTDYKDVIFATAPDDENGSVYISRLQRSEHEVANTIVTNTSTDITKFGTSLFVSTDLLSTSTSAVMMVGGLSTGTNSITVTPYYIGFESLQVSVTTGTQISIVSSSTQFAIAGSNDGSLITISAPDLSSVYVYKYLDNDYQQVATITTSTSSTFGDSIVVSADGSYILISDTNIVNSNLTKGKVYVYQYIDSSYSLVQTLQDPMNDTLLNFGTSLELNSSTDTLVIAAKGYNNFVGNTFDTYSEISTKPEQVTKWYVTDINSDKNAAPTTFDNETCQFSSIVTNVGTVYIFNKFNEKFIFAEELFDTTIQPNSEYGQSISLRDDSVFVGAPQAIINSYDAGGIYIYSKIDPSVKSWNEYRTQPDTVDLIKVKKAITIDTLSNQVIEYLDIFDPIKGRIPGIADQEIRYKTPFDPAIYSIGVQGVVVDNNASWIEDHVGELWWDLSTIKYVWYEQGDLEYRKNSWGNLFPGASVDIYEWVKSDSLPSQWSATADTINGLTAGISGQPKYADNSVLSVKEFYNPSTGSTSNVYFYWVKNSVIIPMSSARRLSANDVSRLIYDPAAYGNKFISVLAPNAVSVTNMKSSLIADQIHLNIATDDIDSNSNKHTEWLLLEEGSAVSMPNALLDKKLIDSLLGKDSLGNIVPDPTLSDRIKYGISIRPRQSMFKDRRMALRNAIDYVNSVLETSTYIASDIINFTNLNSKEAIPDSELHEYDVLLDNNEALSAILIRDIKPAFLEIASIIDGRITAVTIKDPGFGYKVSPTITVNGDLSGAYLTTEIDSVGKVIAVSIVNQGNGLDEFMPPRLDVRPFTAIVEIDETSGNKWATYKLINSTWVKVHTQQYDTTLYWDYKDWKSADYDPLKPFSATVDYTFEVAKLDLIVGDYVKVNNQGNGRYVVLKKINKETTVGTFNSEYDIVYSENGTIKINDTIWNLISSTFNWDFNATFDQTLYNQEPEVELSKILIAIKEDIFVGPLKVYWNKFFFKAVKYAMTEQNFIDWAFKTSFINVKNLAGKLDQRSAYKLQNSKYYEDYLNEVKPYHSKVRNFQTEYTVSETPELNITDFDLPVAYNPETRSFTPLEIGDYELTQSPYNQWTNNYKLTVGAVELTFGGSGYTIAPVISIIPAPGCQGTGATAIAYISKGVVIAIELTNAGSGYTKIPTVVFSYGGSSDVVHARAYARLVSDKVRTNLIGLRFDRISYDKELISTTADDTFYCNGISDFEFPLTWAAANDKSGIDITLNGIMVLASDYNIVTTSTRVVSTATIGSNIGYNKLYSKIRLNAIPEKGVLRVNNYTKHIDLYNAADRISDFYEPGIGMPGKELGQVMSGIDFPGTKIETIPFDYSVNWGVENTAKTMSTFGVSAWADDYDFFTTLGIASTGTTGTNVIQLTSVTGLELGQYAGVTINGFDSTSTFSTPAVYITGINKLTNTVSFSSEFIQTVESTSTNIMKFWSYNYNPAVLDTLIEGGSWTTGTTTGSVVLVGSLGINPEDINLSGDAFMSPITSYGPEEFLPGEVRDSLAINVFTRTGSGSPIVMYKTFYVVSTETSTTVTLPMLPPNSGALSVTFNNQILHLDDGYTLDYNNHTITISTQSTTGLVSVCIMGIGGIGFISNDHTTVSNTSTVSVRCFGTIDTIGSVYVTLDGIALPANAYKLGTVSSTNKTGVVTVIGLSEALPHTLQAWFFTQPNKGFSEIREHVIVTTGTAVSYVLDQYPGYLGSIQGQSIVELDSVRLIPPDTAYYTVEGTQTVFLIDNNDILNPRQFDMANLEVYVNGNKIPLGFNYIIDQPTNSLIFAAGFLKNGDELAITNYAYADYHFKDGKIWLNKYTLDLYPGRLLRVITFTNSDGSLIRTETFKARSSHQYVLSRSIMSDEYVWVTKSGIPLTNKVDYYLAADYRTVIINNSIPITDREIVVIMSMYDRSADYNIGYRLFKDIFGRSQFKRLSEANSTRLSQPLYTTSTFIHVEDADVLPAADRTSYFPGIIIIAGERIEYMEKSGNVLTRLRRGTLGTGAKDYPIGTVVTDQSISHTIPYNEVQIKQVFTVTNVSTVTSFVMSGLKLNPSVSLNDQVEVYYGGRLLRKPTPGGIRTVHNPALSFDSGEFDSDTVLLPEFNIVSTGTTGTLTISLSTETAIGTQIAVLQRVATPGVDWYLDNGSLIEDSSQVAQFLRERPAPLPDKYHYGQF